MQQTKELGRLLFTRKDGESFVIDNDTTVTVRHLPGRRATIDITHADGRIEVFTVNPREAFHPLPNVLVEVDYDDRRAKSRKVMVLAPKTTRVLRSELLNESNKTAKAPTV